jgi:hypothetical protein
MLKKISFLFILSLSILFLLYFLDYTDSIKPSNATQSFSIAKLDESILDFASYSMRICDDTLLLLDYEDQKIAFFSIVDNKFAYLTKIGSLGNGPQETQRIDNYYYHSKTLYLVDNVLHKVIGMNIETNNIVFEYKFKDNISRAYFLDENYLVYHNNADSVRFYKLNLKTKETSILGKAFYREFATLSLDGFYLNSDSIIYYFAYNSSEVFMISNGKIERKLSIDKLEKVDVYRTSEGDIVFGDDNYILHRTAFFNNNEIYVLKGFKVKTEKVIVDIYDTELNYSRSINLKDSSKINDLKISKNFLITLENYEKLQLYKVN